MTQGVFLFLRIGKIVCFLCNILCRIRNSEQQSKRCIFFSYSRWHISYHGHVEWNDAKVVLNLSETLLLSMLAQQAQQSMYCVIVTVK